MTLQNTNMPKHKDGLYIIKSVFVFQANVRSAACGGHAVKYETDN